MYFASYYVSINISKLLQIHKRGANNATFSTVNFFYNLFDSMNRQYFNTGDWKGFSPLNRDKMKYG